MSSYTQPGTASPSSSPAALIGQPSEGLPPSAPSLAASGRHPHAAARLLDGLQALLSRHRALLGGREVAGPHVELIAAEVAHEVAIARAALRNTSNRA